MRKDGTEYRVDQLKYTCYYKTRKLNNCNGQTSYIAETIDEAIVDVLNDLFRKIKETPKDKALGKNRNRRSERANRNIRK